MVARVISGTTFGLDALPVEVEVNIEHAGFPGFTIVGLPDKAVEESKERVRSALKNTGMDFPARRITVNLAPADLPKKGPSYDLPIALGILIASEQLTVDISDSLFLGELSLDGQLRHTPGVLPLAFLAKDKSLARLFLPALNATEAAVVDGITVFPLASLKELIDHFRDGVNLSPQPYANLTSCLTDSVDYEIDFCDIRGQHQSKRALEISAAGGHNTMMSGPPGAGKTLMARALASILPQLTLDEALEVTKIYSISGKLPPNVPFISERPFRSPHHTTSRVGLIGGGSYPQPGEISLAHRGVLFLDEFPEYPRGVLESLRQPLEDGVVTVSRAAGSLTFPAKFILVASQNPCACGYKGDLQHQCSCTPQQILRYKKRVSGPILDRIDLHVEVPAVKHEELTNQDQSSSESSGSIRERVQKSREIQQNRYKEIGIKSNAELTIKFLNDYCQLGMEESNILRQAMLQMKLSARSYHRILKVARTIADLSASNNIEVGHLAEALQFRRYEG